MTFTEKLIFALKLLESKGISRAHYSPVFYRLFWQVGIEIPPPHFAGFFFNFFVLGGLFSFTGFLLSVIAKLVGWSSAHSLWSALPYILVYGVIFGLVMGSVYSIGSRRHKVPHWVEFQP